MPCVQRLVPILLSTLALFLVIWKVEPPASLTTASVGQVVLFFIPFIILSTLVANILLASLLKGFIIALGFALLLVLSSLDLLNLFSGVIVAVLTTAAIITVRQPKRYSYQAKIPKLSQLGKQR